MGEESTCDERLNLLDEQVRTYLAKAFKAQHSAKQTDCMIGYVRDMLLKVSQRSTDDLRMRMCAHKGV